MANHYRKRDSEPLDGSAWEEDRPLAGALSWLPGNGCVARPTQPLIRTFKGAEGVAAGSVTVTVVPAIVNVPVRDEAVEFPATV